MTTHVERSIEVNVPVSTVYNQWTQFEDFPRFMGGVQQVRQVGDTLTHWVAEIAGVRREWDAEIVEQVPDQKVAWAATTGATNAGAVFFDAVGADRTRVRLTLDYEPEGIVEKIGDVLDVVERQAVADLDRFKSFIEARGAATGGWRGSVDEAGAPAVGANAAAAGGVAAADDDADRTGTAAGAGATAGVAGFGTDTGLSSGDPASGAFTGDPGARTASHAGTGTGDLVGEVGMGHHEAWTDQPGARTEVTEAATDPVGEDWAGEPGAGERGTGARYTDDVRGASTDPVGESWADDPGSRSAATGTDEPWAAGASGPGERRDAGTTGHEGVVQRDFADETISTDDVVARDFANRDVSGEGVVERDFANRDITERDIANRGVTDPRSGTADDPDNPTRPSV